MAKTATIEFHTGSAKGGILADVESVLKGNAGIKDRLSSAILLTGLGLKCGIASVGRVTFKRFINKNPNPDSSYTTISASLAE